MWLPKDIYQKIYTNPASGEMICFQILLQISNFSWCSEPMQKQMQSVNDTFQLQVWLISIRLDAFFVAESSEI